MGLKVEVATLDVPKAPWARSFPIPTHALGERNTTALAHGFSKKFLPWLKENRSK